MFNNFRFIIATILMVITIPFATAGESKNEKLYELLNFDWRPGTTWKIRKYDSFKIYPKNNFTEYNKDKYSILKYEVLDNIEFEKNKLSVMKVIEYVPDKSDDSKKDPFACNEFISYYYFSSENKSLKYYSSNTTIDKNSNYLEFRKAECLNKNAHTYYPEMDEYNLKNDENEQIIECDTNSDSYKIIVNNENVYYWKIGQPWWYKMEKLSMMKKYGNIYGVTEF